MVTCSRCNKKLNIFSVYYSDNPKYQNKAVCKQCVQELDKDLEPSKKENKNIAQYQKFTLLLAKGEKIIKEDSNVVYIDKVKTVFGAGLGSSLTESSAVGIYSGKIKELNLFKKENERT